VVIEVLSDLVLKGEGVGGWVRDMEGNED